MTSAELTRQAHEARVLADELARRALAARHAEEAARRPKMPTVSVGAPVVVTFSKAQSGRVYSFAAVGFRISTGMPVRWAVTGEETRRFNWSGLLNFIGEANWPTLRVMNDGDLLVPEGTEPPVAERMGNYGRVLSTDLVQDGGFPGGGRGGGYV